jgi:hypothetical protein
VIFSRWQRQWFSLIRETVGRLVVVEGEKPIRDAIIYGCARSPRRAALEGEYR